MTPLQWLSTFDLDQFTTAYLTVPLTILVLGYATTTSPSSSLATRRLAAVLVLILTTITAHSMTTAKAFYPFRTTIGIALGLNVLFESVDNLLYRRAYTDLSKAPTQGLLGKCLYTARQGADLVFNKRRIGTAAQVKGVPVFDPQNPSFIPSRRRFLVTKTLRIIVLYTIGGILTSQPPPPEILRTCAITTDTTRSILPIRMFQGTKGDITSEELTWRLILSISFLLSASLFLVLGHDIASLFAVAVLGNSPAAWPPHFNYLSHAYSVRHFWSDYWHQDLRAVLTFQSDWVADHVLFLPKKGVVQRYTRIMLVFLFSGLVHVYGETLAGLGAGETRVVHFFVACGVGICVEDLAKAAWRGFVLGKGLDAREVGTPGAFARLVGYVWTVAWMALVTPQWACPFVSVPAEALPGWPREM